MRPVASDCPAWRDPRYLSAQRVAQHEAYELVLRRLAWALAERRLQALLPTERLVWSDDFEGCVE
jgi:hypothetical protein